jgi:hypothetical protein
MLTSAPATPRGAWALAAGLIAVIVGFYGWTVGTSGATGAPPLWGEPQADYENMVMHAFRGGHLYLEIAPDPRLAQAANPYDVASLPPGTVLVHDASYYHGHYYVYFGVTPVVVMLWPWRWLTGHDLSQTYAVLLFTVLGFLAAAALWLALRRRYFPQSGAAVLLAGIGALGLASATHALLRRPDFWEQPIAAGYAFAMLTLLGLERALHGPRPGGWLAGAGLSLGLAVGARPTYLVGAAAFLPVLGWLWFRGRPAGSSAGPRRRPVRAWWGQVLALGLAFGAVLAGLLWYNYARFGNPLEFGASYQTAYASLASVPGVKPRLFSPAFAGFNAWIYYWAPPQWSRYFPFVKMIHVPPGSPDFEYVYGLLPHFPFVLLALLAPLGLRRRPPGERGALAAMLGAIAAFYLAIGGLLLCFVGTAGRYMVDFAPALILLSGLGLLGAERAARGPLRTGVRAVGAAAAVFSAFVGLMLSFQVHNVLRDAQPRTYQRLAHAFDTPVAALERRGGTRFGPLELTLRFPRVPAGTMEPLVTTGWEYESDYLFVRYLDGDRLQLGFAHSNQSVIWSPIVAADRGQTHRLEARLGSLFPPLGHPYFDRMSRYSAAGLKRWLRVTLDGQDLFDLMQDFYDSSPGNVRLGGGPLQPKDFGRRFTGQLVAGPPGPVAYSPPLAVGYGAYEITLVLPGAFPLALPVVTAGRPGRADILLVRQTGPGRVRFGYDHWGVGYWESGDIPMASGVPHVLRAVLPSLSAPGSPASGAPNLALVLDSRSVWTRNVPFYAVKPEEFYFGENPIGASTCEAKFTGLMLDVRRR